MLRCSGSGAIPPAKAHSSPVWQECVTVVDQLAQNNRFGGMFSLCHVNLADPSLPFWVPVSCIFLAYPDAALRKHSILLYHQKHLPNGRKFPGQDSTGSEGTGYTHRACAWRIVTGEPILRLIALRSGLSLTFGTHPVAVKRSEPRSALQGCVATFGVAGW